MLLVTALLAWPITATQAKPWAVLMVFVAGLVAATREAFARKRGDRELYKQYRLMYQLFSDARHALSTESAPEAQQRIMRALGNAALLEHAEWLLLHRERPIEVSRI